MEVNRAGWPVRPPKPEVWRCSGGFVAFENAQNAAAVGRGDAMERRRSLPGTPRQRRRSPSPALRPPSQPASRPTSPMAEHRQLVQRQRQAWLAAIHDGLQRDPGAADYVLFRARLEDVGVDLPPMPTSFRLALSRVEPAWMQLRLGTLLALLDGAFGEALGNVPQTAPGLMVTPPPDEVSSDDVDDFARLRSRYGRSPARGETEREEAAQERAWLEHMFELLRLPSPRPHSPNQPARPRSPTGGIPRSLTDKLEQASVAWRDICAGELVELVVALDLVPFPEHL